MSSAGPGEALQMTAAPRSRRLYEQVVETIPAYQFVVGRARRQKRPFGDASKLRGSGTLSRQAARARKPAARDDAADVARYFR
jgi:hypothetical protein